MAFNLAPNLQPQYLDENANPLSGGLLYSYLAGSTTPVDTYTDSTGSTVNSNPIVLDSAGRANIWLNTNVVYKFVMYDSNSVLQWSVDNVSAAGGSGGGGSTSGLVKVSADDLAAQYLEQKLVGGNKISLSVTNPGAVEQLTISLDQLNSDDIDNNSGVAGANVSNALDELENQIGALVIPNIPSSALDGAFVIKNSDGSYSITDNNLAPKFNWNSAQGRFEVGSSLYLDGVPLEVKNSAVSVYDGTTLAGGLYKSSFGFQLESFNGNNLVFSGSGFLDIRMNVETNQNITANGVSDFTSGLIYVPTPATATEAANKDYVDNAIPSTPTLQQVTDAGNFTTQAIVAASFNGATITSAGGGTNFLADDGTYKAASGGGASEGSLISGATSNRLVTTDSSGNLNTADAPSWDPSGTDTILNLPNTLANGAILGKTIDTGWLGLLGGTSETNAASIRLYGSGTLGSGRLRYNGTTRLLWDGTNVDVSDTLRALNGVEVTGNAEVSGEVVGSASTFNIRTDNNSKSINIIGGSTTANNVSLALLEGGIGRMRYNGITEALWGDGYFGINNILKMASTTNASPANGDIWFDGTNLKGREGGATFNLNSSGGVTPGSWTTATLQTNWEARSGYRAVRYRDNGIDGTEIEGVAKLKTAQSLLGGGSVVLFTLPVSLRPTAKLTGLVSCTYEGSWQSVTGVWYEVDTNGDVTITNSNSTLITELYNIGINIKFAQS